METTTFDFWDFGFKLVMSVSLWLLLREYWKLFKLNKSLQGQVQETENKAQALVSEVGDMFLMGGIVSSARNRHHYMQRFNNDNPPRTPQEYDNEYKMFVATEYQYMIDILQKRCSNKSRDQINEILVRYYDYEMAIVNNRQQQIQN